MPSATEQFISDVLDIFDTSFPNFKLPPNTADAHNILRRALGKRELEVLSAASVVTYFTATTTSNPPVVTFPTSGGSISFTGASFSNGAWTLGASASLTFTYSQSAFQNDYYPVSLILTGNAAPGTTALLNVNQIALSDPTYPLDQAISTTAGQYEFFVPAPCFLGGANTFTFSITSGSFSNLTAVSVVNAIDVGDVDATINALTQALARLGTENTNLKNAWNTIINTLTTYPQLSSFVSPGQSLQSRWTDLNIKMKQQAQSLQGFLQQYNDSFLPTVISTSESRDSKIAAVQRFQGLAQTNQQATLDMTNALVQYKADLQAFQSQVQTAATAANVELQQKLTSVANQIAAVRGQIASLQAKYNIAKIGVGASIFAGAVGFLGGMFFLGPIGAVFGIGLAIVGVIGLGVSVGFVASLGNQINAATAQLVNLENQQRQLISQDAQVQAMLSAVTTSAQSTILVANYTQAFQDLWNFINTQLNGILSEFQQFPTTNNPILFQIYVNSWVTQVQPYLDKINVVLTSYVNSF